MTLKPTPDAIFSQIVFYTDNRCENIKTIYTSPKHKLKKNNSKSSEKKTKIDSQDQ